MSIVFNKDSKTFSAEQVLWAKRELVAAIVEQALVNQAEAHLDMIMDMEKPEDITRATVNESLRSVKEMTAVFLSDVCGDLERELLARLEKVKFGAAVTGIKYGLAGDVKDIELDVTVSE